MLEARENIRPILPKLADEWHPTTLTNTSGSVQLTSGPQATGSFAKPRKPKSSTKTREEWEAQREKIQELYVVRDLKLDEVMVTMRETHGFQAS